MFILAKLVVSQFIVSMNGARAATFEDVAGPILLPLAWVDHVEHCARAVSGLNPGFSGYG